MVSNISLLSGAGMFKKNRRQRQPRKVKTELEDGDDNGDANPDVESDESNKSGVGVPNNRSKKMLPTLSFGSDDIGEGNVSGALKSSKKRRRATVPAPILDIGGDNAEECGSLGVSSLSDGRYSKQGLAELRSSQKYHVATSVEPGVDDNEDGTSRIYSGEQADKLCQLSEDGRLSRGEIAQEIRKSHEEVEDSDEFIPLESGGKSYRMKDNLGTSISAIPIDDDELESWESEQVSRGKSTGAELSCSGPKKSTVRPSTTQADGSNFIPVDLKEVDGALKMAEEEVQNSLERLERNVNQVEANAVAASGLASQLKIDIESAGKMFEHFQRIRDYLVDLCGMLRAKEPRINEIIVEMESAYASRCKTRILHRREAVEDGILDSLNGTPAIQPRDILGVYRPMVAGPISLQLVPGASKERLQQARAERQTTRSKRKCSSDEEISLLLEGSGGEETASEALAITVLLAGIEEKAAACMDDVDEEVRSLECLKIKLETWKQRFRNQYDQCFVSLAIPKLLAPFAKLELVGWDVLQFSSVLSAPGSKFYDSVHTKPWKSSEFVSHFNWYKYFVNFGAALEPRAHMGQVDEEDEDPDNDLVPKLVELVVLPSLMSALKTAYDPVSVKQTKSAIAAVSEALSFEPSDGVAKDLLSSPLPALCNAVEALCIPVVKRMATSPPSEALCALTKIQVSCGYIFCPPSPMFRLSLNPDFAYCFFCFLQLGAAFHPIWK